MQECLKLAKLSAKKTRIIQNWTWYTCLEIDFKNPIFGLLCVTYLDEMFLQFQCTTLAIPFIIDTSKGSWRKIYLMSTILGNALNNF